MSKNLNNAYIGQIHKDTYYIKQYKLKMDDIIKSLSKGDDYNIIRIYITDKNISNTIFNFKKIDIKKITEKSKKYKIRNREFNRYIYRNMFLEINKTDEKTTYSLETNKCEISKNKVIAFYNKNIINKSSMPVLEKYNYCSDIQEVIVSIGQVDVILNKKTNTGYIEISSKNIEFEKDNLQTAINLLESS